MRRFTVACFALLLAGCSPALVLNLYNATGDTLRVTNPPLRRVVTIPPHSAADVGIGADVLIRTSQHSWRYLSRSLTVPTSLLQQHTMLWRAFGMIDDRGSIYLFSPPGDHGKPQKITQPRGFPARADQT